MQGTVLCKRRSCYSDGCWGVTRVGRVVWPQKYWVHPLVSGFWFGAGQDHSSGSGSWKGLVLGGRQISPFLGHVQSSTARDNRHCC